MERVSVLRNLDLRFRNLRTKRSFLWIVGSVSLILILSFVAAHLLDEPLRKKMEAEINNSLKGYTVSIERLDFHPFGLSLDLNDSTIYQSAHPDPPIAQIPNLSASIHWKALLRGQLVADWEASAASAHTGHQLHPYGPGSPPSGFAAAAAASDAFCSSGSSRSNAACVSARSSATRSA